MSFPFQSQNFLPGFAAFSLAGSNPTLSMMGQNPMATGMMMMAMMQMMSMMSQMLAQNSGQFPMSMMPGFGGMNPAQMMNGFPGSPLGSFLGSGGANPMNFPGGFQQSGYASGGVGGEIGGVSGQAGGVLAPGGKVGNIDIGRLISAVPSNLRASASKHFPVIVAEAQKQGISNKAQLAYILATATHESNAGKNMEEFDSGRRYEGRRDLGNTQSGDGSRFKGRGYVQLTGRRNYADWSRRTGMDLVGNPRQVENPAIAARILVEGMKKGTFTGKRLDQYINNQRTDFGGARRIINGTDRAGQIGSLAQKLMATMG